MVSIYPGSCLSVVFCAVMLLPFPSIAQTVSPSSSTETREFLVHFAESRKQASDIQVSFREKRFLPFMENPIESAGTLAFHPPNCFRRKVDHGSLTVCNGQTLWIYNPALQQMEIYNLNKTPFLADTLTAMTAAFSASQLLQLFHCTLYRNSDGASILHLVPRRGVLRKVASKITLVLRPDFSASRLEIISPEGDRTLTTFGEESQVQFTPQTFELRPPPGTRISRPLAK